MALIDRSSQDKVPSRSYLSEPQTNLWKEGMENWQPANTVLPQLFADQPSSPPALPPNAPVGAATGQRSHEIDYELFGEEMEIKLDPGETVPPRGVHLHDPLHQQRSHRKTPGRIRLSLPRENRPAQPRP